ncbi:MAG: amylo-alpha-1,6-glucosidase [[Clostridium] fimetarium]|nr:amylo-alpha-1,6-glucosidase [Alistipes timonensis]MCM1404859.1 amylo-alpha-1,6-glucosidase [[Clostridium] fimetarium]
MSYLKFDKNLMINLEQSLPKEMLRTNQAGAYHCTSIVDCNTRKQHGLLVVPIGEEEYDPHVLLSSLDETVIQHGAPFNLGLHRYQGGVYSPNGHKYIREFDCEGVPRTTYRVGGVVLTKEKIFIQNENRILIRYTLLEAHSPTTLQLRPFLAFRSSNALCMANDRANTDCLPVQNGVACCLYEGYPTLYMQLSRKPEFVHDPHWYNNIEYVKDMDRGVPYVEDLMVPGYFQVSIKKGESIIFSAGLSEVSTRSLGKMYEGEIASRTRRTSFFNCLKNAAKQLYLKKDGAEYMLSGYPWGKILARNTFMSLPGNTIAIGHREDFERIMDTATVALENFMATLAHSKMIHGIAEPDIPVWAIWAIQQYAKSYGMEAARERYLGLTASLLDFVIAGGNPRLTLESDGLLSTDGTMTPASWMNSVWDGRPVVPRTGKLVEINALWYNALRFAAELAQGEEKYEERATAWADIADKAREAFAPTFLNDYGYLYDYVTGQYSDPSVRPNMVIAVGLDHSPLDRRQRKGVLDVVTRELLTPKGLRTLSPKSYGYRPFYLGSPQEREIALHNGPARPWLIGFYADAYLKVFGLSGRSYVDRMLIGFEEEMSQGCIGSLSQLYDGNPPFAGRGAISHATNIAEVLRTLRTLKKLDS